jgi:acetylornithine deacetylase/succinyl-diaminopimelate desuccinylase-like protein
VWPGAAYDLGRFRKDAALLAGVDPVGEGAIGDLLWARPAATVLAIDAPPTARVTASVQGEASAIVNLRVPATMDPAVAQQRLVEHLRAHTPYGLVEIEPLTLGRGFAARTDGPAYAAIRAAMAAAYGREAVETGQGGSIP